MLARATFPIGSFDSNGGPTLESFACCGEKIGYTGCKETLGRDLHLEEGAVEEGAVTAQNHSGRE
jgi:hypothetical protein